MNSVIESLNKRGSKFKRVSVFLGAYINCTNALNINCLALAKYLDKKKFKIYTLALYSGNLPTPNYDDVKIFKSFSA